MRRNDIPQLRPTVHIDAVPALRGRPSVETLRRRRARRVGLVSALGGAVVTIALVLSPALQGKHRVSPPAGVSEHPSARPASPEAGAAQRTPSEASPVVSLKRHCA